MECPATPSTGCTGSPASDVFTVTAPSLLRGDSTGSVDSTTSPLVERRPFLSLSLPEWAHEIDEAGESPCSSSSFEDLFPSPVASPVSRGLDREGGAAPGMPPPRRRSDVRWADLDESDDAPGTDDVWHPTVSKGPRAVCWADLAESEDEAPESDDTHGPGEAQSDQTDPSGPGEADLDGNQEEGRSPRAPAAEVAAEAEAAQDAHRFKGTRKLPASPESLLLEPASPSECAAPEGGTRAPKRTGSAEEDSAQGATAPEADDAIAGPSTPTTPTRTAGTNMGGGGGSLPCLLARQVAQEPHCRGHTGAGGRPRPTRARGRRRRWSLQGCREAPVTWCV